MEKQFITFMLFFLLYSICPSQTSVPSGVVSGTWSKAGSPYLVQGHLLVPQDSTLSISPGVQILFQGHYKLFVSGRIIAIGTQIDTILFSASDTAVGWWGIRYDGTSAGQDSSFFVYCKVERGNANGSGDDLNGGGFFIKNFSKIRISNSHITKNSAWIGASGVGYGGGGGIYCFGSSPLIVGNTISHNQGGSEYGSGGGIYCSGGSPSILGNTINNNNGHGDGGGIYCSMADAIIKDNVIDSNIAYYNRSDGSGGGIFCYGGNPLISDNTIYTNISYADGGGICCRATALITNNNISNNAAIAGVSIVAYGGGIYCFDVDSTVSISGNIISNNTAASGGAGIYCGNSRPNIYNCTIVNNRVLGTGASDGGGGLYCNQNSTPKIINTIIFGNLASGVNGNQVFLNDNASDPSFLYCDLKGGIPAFTSVEFNTNGNPYTGSYSGIIDSVPLFEFPSAVAGGDFSGTAANWALQKSSPCIDNGTPSSAILGLPAVDIAGNPRIVNNRVDIGAFEYQGSMNIVHRATSQSKNSNSGRTCTVTLTKSRPQASFLNCRGQRIESRSFQNRKTFIWVIRQMGGR